MNPIEAMARAYWDAWDTGKEWDALHNLEQVVRVNAMRAALIALRDCEVPDDIVLAWLEARQRNSLDYQSQLRAMISAILEKQP